MSRRVSVFFFFNDTATTEIYTLSLHDALPISRSHLAARASVIGGRGAVWYGTAWSRSWMSCRLTQATMRRQRPQRSEEHTSELQSLAYLVCRLLLEKKKIPQSPREHTSHSLSS